jgi:hypothetical protein
MLLLWQQQQEVTYLQGRGWSGCLLQLQQSSVLAVDCSSGLVVWLA